MGGPNRFVSMIESLEIYGASAERFELQAEQCRIFGPPYRRTARDPLFRLIEKRDDIKPRKQDPVEGSGCRNKFRTLPRGQHGLDHGVDRGVFLPRRN